MLTRAMQVDDVMALGEQLEGAIDRFGAFTVLSFILIAIVVFVVWKWSKSQDDATKLQMKQMEMQSKQLEQFRAQNEELVKQTGILQGMSHRDTAMQASLAQGTQDVKDAISQSTAMTVETLGKMMQKIDALVVEVKQHRVSDEALGSKLDLLRKDVGTLLVQVEKQPQPLTTSPLRSEGEKSG